MTQDALFYPADLTIEQILSVLTPELRCDPSLWPSVFRDLISVLATRNLDENTTAEQAVEKAQDLVLVMANRIGGRPVYLPRDARLPEAVREILEQRAKGEGFRERLGVAEWMKDGHCWGQVLIELVDALAWVFDVRQGLGPEQVGKQTLDAIMAMAKYRGGRPMYLPQDTKIRLAIRDQAVVESFDGGNHQELSWKTRLTTTRIYDILKTKRDPGKVLNGRTA